MQKKLSPKELFEEIRQMAQRSTQLIPVNIQEVMRAEDDLMRFRVVTGYSKEKAMEIQTTLRCSLGNAADFFAVTGKLPDEFYQQLLRKYEVRGIIPMLHGIGDNRN